MQGQFSRTELLIGKSGLEKLQNSKVAVFGIGGVGGYVVEALVRSGLGEIDIIDCDKVSVSNINRQIYATTSTVGMYKVDAAEQRIKDINPECKVNKYKIFYNPDTAADFDFGNYNYVVDAIDTVSGKIELVLQANKTNTPIISSMGAGNKMKPQMFEVSDIYKTSVCPLAKVMRQELKKRNIKKLKVVYSKEPPIKKTAQPLPNKENFNAEENIITKKHIPGSNSFVPPTVGLIIAGEVIQDLIN